MPASRLDRYFAANSDMKAVTEKALEILALSKLCSAYLPPEVTAHVRVANFKDGHLVLFAENPSAAARFKLHGESLSAFLSIRQGQPIAVSVKVQPNISHRTHVAAHHGPRPTVLATERKAPFSPATLSELDLLCRSLPDDSPAHEALRTLLAHHGYARLLHDDPEALEQQQHKNRDQSEK